MVCTINVHMVHVCCVLLWFGPIKCAYGSCWLCFGPRKCAYGSCWLCFVVISSHKMCIWFMFVLFCCVLGQSFIQVQIKKNTKVPCQWLCEGKSPVTGQFPAQRASNMENVSISWCHDDYLWLLSNGSQRRGLCITHSFLLFSNDLLGPDSI